MNHISDDSGSIHVEIRLQHCSLTPERRDYLAAELGKLPRLVAKFPNPHLHADVEKFQNGTFKIHLSLALSGETRTAGAEHENLVTAWHRAIEKLASSVIEYKDKLDHRREWSRTAAVE